MTDEPVNGSCYCGKSAFEYVGLPSGAIHCHCGMCRRLSGAAFTTWESIPTQNFRLLSSYTLKKFSPSENSVRNFCGDCGTHLFTEDLRYPAVVAIPAGLISAALNKKIDGHYFVSHKAEWHVIGDELPQFGGEAGFERISV